MENVNNENSEVPVNEVTAADKTVLEQETAKNDATVDPAPFVHPSLVLSGYISNSEVKDKDEAFDTGEPISPVVDFSHEVAYSLKTGKYADSGYVIIILKDGSRVPVDMSTALQRCIALRESLRCDDGSTPYEVLERRAWLINGVIKQIKEIIVKCNLPISLKGVEAFMKNVDTEIKKAKTRSFKRD